MGNLRSVKKVCKQLLYILTTKQKQDSILVFVSMIVLSLLELMGVTSIYPFLQTMMNPEQIREEWYGRWAYSIWPDMTGLQITLMLGIMLVIVYLIKNAFALVCIYIQCRFATAFKRIGSKRMLDSYLKRPYEYFVNTNSGYILRGINSDINSSYVILCNMFTICSELMTIVILGVYLFLTDWFISLCAMGLAATCFLFIVLGFKGTMKQTGKEFRKAIGRQNQYAYQAINGIKEITVSDRRQYFVEAFNEVSKQVEHADAVNSFVLLCPDRILEGVCISGLIGIVCIRVSMGVDMETFIPILGSFAMAAFRILPSISKISSRMNGIVYGMPALQNCYDNLRTAEQYDKALSQLPDYDGYAAQEENLQFHKALEIKNVTWKYKNAQKPVLQGLSLTIERGESVAFIGSSGAGKTTLADVIMGLLRPQAGTVEMDGKDIYSMPHEWAHIIGYIPQSVFLIDDTIRANVAFGLPDKLVSDERVWLALEKAQLLDFVEKLPAGLDTIVGERGVKFSGGQRQRIAIARALYENPDILVLDEATSALDNETETAVMESIDALQGSITMIIVAHRLTTIRNCDRIFEIKDGVAFERDKAEVLGIH